MEVVAGDRAAATKKDNEDGEADRCFSSRYGQHEHGHDLSDDVTQESREGDEVDVHCEQDVLDRHEDQDDVAAVDENSEHAQHEQDRGDGQIMGERDHIWTPSPTAGLDNFTASAGRRLTCRPTFGVRRSPRLRWVSTIAPIIAT